MSEERKRVLAILSVVLGVLGLGLAACLAACGAVLAIASIVLGVLSIRSESKVLAIIGLVLGGLGLLGSAVNMVLGAYLMMSGQHPLGPLLGSPPRPAVVEPAEPPRDPATPGGEPAPLP